MKAQKALSRALARLYARAILVRVRLVFSRIAKLTGIFVGGGAAVDPHHRPRGVGGEAAVATAGLAGVTQK